MRKLLYVILSTCMVFCLLFAVGCGAQKDNQIPTDGWGLVFTIETAYAEAQELGYQGTLEDFLATIKGRDGSNGQNGKDGVDGLGIKAVKIVEGDLIVVFTDDSSVNCGKIVEDRHFQMHTITFVCESEYVEDIPTQSVQHGEKVKKPNIQIPDGIEAEIEFICQGERWSFIGYSVTEDITIEVKVTIIGTSGLVYAEDGDGYKVTGYTGTAEKVVVPNVYNGKPVIGIGDGAFRDNSVIKTVIISRGVTYLAPGAFKHSSIQSISLPNSLTVIRNNAFEYCYSLAEIVIPNGVKTIGEDAFKQCSILKRITLPSSLIKVENGAFGLTGNDEGLERVNYLGTIDDWVAIDFESVNANPLYHVKSVYKNSLYINNELVTHASLTTATKIKNFAFYGYQKLESVSIPSGVFSIGNEAFSGCKKLETVNFEANSQLKTIGTSAFSTCSALKSIDIPYGVTSISSGTFMSSGIESVTIPNSVEIIDAQAFFLCGRLNGVQLPNSVKSVGLDAFASCARLSLNSTEDAKYLGNTSNPYLVLIEAIDTTLTSCVIKGQTKVIADEAFEDCSNLETVTFEADSQLKHIGNSAFYNCGKLKNITIPSKVETIGDYAFSKCSTIESLNLPSSLLFIDSGAFNKCTALQSVAFEANSQLKTISNSAFKECSSLKNIDIPYGVTTIGDTVFSDCTELINISIPSTIEGFGREAFKNCDKLVYTTLNGVKYLGNSENEYQVLVGVVDKTITSVEIKKETTIIADSAFEGCSSLASATFEADSQLKHIGCNAFAQCTALTSITIPNGVKSIKKYAFSFCNSLANISLPNSITDIGAYAFQGMAIESITIPNSVINLESAAFYACYNLQSVAFEANSQIKIIEDYTFGNCYSLISITIPNSVEKIGLNVFWNCSPTSVTFEEAANWYMTLDSDYVNGVQIDVSNANANAINIVKINDINYLYKQKAN